jgi:hypothetical protein
MTLLNIFHRSRFHMGIVAIDSSPSTITPTHEQCGNFVGIRGQNITRNQDDSFITCLSIESISIQRMMGAIFVTNDE